MKEAAKNPPQDETEPTKNSVSTKSRNEELENRERERQVAVNAAFALLRTKVPSYPYEKKMSKQEILRSAINYVRVLSGVLGPDVCDQMDWSHVPHNYGD